MDNARCPKHLWIFSFHNHASGLANRCIICNDFHTRINTYIFNNLKNNSPIYCESLYCPSASTDFKKTGPFKEDNVKLMSECCARSVHPSETMLTPDVGHVDLIGSSILSTSFFSFVNVVLSFSYPEGTSQ